MTESDVHVSGETPAPEPQIIRTDVDTKQTPQLDVAAELSRIADDVRESFSVGRRVLSFREYLDVFGKDPVRQARDASRYVRDMLAYYGTTEVERPWGKATRYRLFDLPFGDAATQREALVGQEDVQAELHRVFSNFGREGRANKLVLLHGPNGSSKSTIAGCLMRALEHYSSTDEGALYRFHWVFPSAKTTKGTLGFRKPEGPKDLEIRPTADDSYARLDDELIDARLFCEVRDHPLFLLPVVARGRFVEQARAGKDHEPASDWVLRGRLSHKSQQVFEALLTSYRGDLTQVLRHVLVERYFISRRYRVGAVTLGPSMSVDAGERQITADRSLASLPSSLQAVTMFEAHGELVDAAGGILEFSDLLKRPVDAYKYLQLSIETGEVALNQQNVQLNCVMVGSANEVHLSALRDHHEWASFRGRIELVRTPYLRSYLDEQKIYDAQIVPQIRVHVAPHATRVAALFAVLTRMRKPVPERFDKPLSTILVNLSAPEKAELFATGLVPERLDEEAGKLLRSSIGLLIDESRNYPMYEGRVGASPREIKSTLLDAAQQNAFLSPLAVLDQLEELSTRTSEYEWLQQEALPGGYHDPRAFREYAKKCLLDAWEQEIQSVSGLVDDQSWVDLFDRYVRHVSVWVKGEKVRNAVTGVYEEANVSMLVQVEKLLGQKGDAGEFRRGLLSALAAWSIDHLGQKIDYERAFGGHLRKLRETSYAERRKALAELCKAIVLTVDGDTKALDLVVAKSAERALAELQSRFGHVSASAREAAGQVLRFRLS